MFGDEATIVIVEQQLHSEVMRQIIPAKGCSNSIGKLQPGGRSK
jgi:hypothetical protein